MLIKLRRVSGLLAVVLVAAGVGHTQQAPGEKAAGKPPRAGVNGVGSPQCIYCPQPEYSDQARAAKYSGTVLLDVTVTADGKVVEPVVLRNPGYGLEEKALQQMPKWKMKSALGSDGKPTDCRVQIEVTFH